MGTTNIRSQQSLACASARATFSELFNRIGPAAQRGFAADWPEKRPFSRVFPVFSGFEGCFFASVAFNHPVANANRQLIFPK